MAKVIYMSGLPVMEELMMIVIVTDMLPVCGLFLSTLQLMMVKRPDMTNHAHQL